MAHRGRQEQRVRIEAAATRAQVSGRTIARALSAGELTKFHESARRLTLLDSHEVDSWAESRIKPADPEAA
jgi:hypothetical protein